MYTARWHKAETAVKGGLAYGEPAVAERLCVMIVEQDLEFGLKLADWLAAYGYHAVLVRSVDEAIEELSEIRPQAVFVGRAFSEPAAQMGMSEILLLIQTLCPRVTMIKIAEHSGEDLTPIVFRQMGSSHSGQVGGVRRDQPCAPFETQLVEADVVSSGT